jgi:hypothetical protein
VDKSKLAPRPNKRGITQAVWDTLDTLGGGTFFQISKYMPAALVQEKKITRKQLAVALDNGVRRGYFVKGPKGYYNIAPKDYWDARDWYRNKSHKKLKKVDEVISGPPSVKAEPTEPTELPRWVYRLVLANGVVVVLLILAGIFGVGYFMGAGQ